MDALLSQSGIIDAKTDIRKAEVYLLAEPGTELPEQDLRRLIENVFGYGLRAYERTTDAQWDKVVSE